MINIRPISILSFSALLLLLPLAGQAHDREESWQKINAPQQATVQVNGAERQVHPGCAFEGDDYAFYYKEGKSDKLAIFFNGGGACWDTNTCLISLNPPTDNIPPAYVPTDDIAHNDPTLHQGMFEFDNPENEYAEWSMLYLPYCTGDVHFGSKDTAYPVGPGLTQTIRHRGFDNFLYARQWLVNHLEAEDGDSPRKVLVTGASAGAYGAVLNYPYIKKSFPEAKGYLLADGGSGVLTDSLIEDAMRGSTSAWNFDNNFATWVPGLASVTGLDAPSFLPAVYSALTNHYPNDKFSQYSTVFDLIQVMFYNIMLNTDNPNLWIKEEVIAGLFNDWTSGMLMNSYTLAAAPNYRFFVAPGCQHTILRSNEMYNEDANTVAGISFNEWFEDLTKGRKYKGSNDWNNLSCTDEGCLTIPLTPEILASCAFTPAQ